MSTSRIPGEFVLLLKGFRKYIFCIPQCYSLLWLLCFVVGLLGCLFVWYFGSYTGPVRVHTGWARLVRIRPHAKHHCFCLTVGKDRCDSLQNKRAELCCVREILSLCTWIFHRLFMNSINIIKCMCYSKKKFENTRRVQRGCIPYFLLHKKPAGLIWPFV